MKTVLHIKRLKHIFLKVFLWNLILFDCIFFSSLRVWQLLEVRREHLRHLPPGLLPAPVGSDQLLALPLQHDDGLCRIDVTSRLQK